MNRPRVIQMRFLAAAELMRTDAFQRHIGIQTQRIKGLLMAELNIVLNVGQAQSADGGDCIGDIPVDHLLDADRLKDLAALIALDGRNAHLGGDPHDTVQDRFIIIIDSRVKILFQQSLLYQMADSLMCQIGMHGAGTIA